MVCLLLLCSGLDCFAVQKQTVRYAEKDGTDLMLDHYISDSAAGQRGCVIFVFGGGFAAGARNSKWYVSFFEWLCDEGYDVFSIDYRLGLSKKYNDYGWKKGAFGLMQRYVKAIDWAIDDLFSATSYILSRADEWNIDKTRILACGSSAGAITCLTAEYRMCSGTAQENVLPKDFNYAGIISMAGAIQSMKGHPKWKSEPCPLMMFHGNADRNVPYKHMGFFGKGMWGSKYIARQMQKNDWNYYFYDARYRDHALASEPMTRNREQIREFLYNSVERKHPFHVHRVIDDQKYPKRKTHFSLATYLRQK